jgi:thiamine transport system permease protein
VGPAVGLVVFYVWPLATLLARGLDVDTLGETLGDDSTWRVVWFTTWQAVVSTLLTLGVGLAPAYVLARYEFPGRRLLDAVLAAVFVLPTVVMGAAMLAVLPPSLERGAVAIVAAHVTFNLAVVVRTVGALLAGIPRDRELAAATLGASPWRAFWTVTFPAIRPALLAAGGVVFVFTFTSFGVVRLLGGVRRSTIEVEIWRQATQFGDIGSAATLTVLQLVLVGAVVILAVVAQRRASGHSEVRTRTQRVSPRRRQRWLVGVVAGLTALIVLAPLAALVERSMRGTEGRHSLSAWRNLRTAEIRPGISLGIDPLASLAVSLRTAVVATVIAALAGTIAAVAIAASSRGGRALDTALMLPLATSAITVGFGMLITFDVPPVDWRAEPWIVPVGHALVAVPFVVRTTLPVLRGIDPHRREAAATLGATPLRAWADVMLPHLRRPLAVAAGISAAISLGEFGATSFLSRSGRETMPIAIERLLSRPGALLQAQGYALAVILAAATILVVTLLDAAAPAGRNAPRRRGTRR